MTLSAMAPALSARRNKGLLEFEGWTLKHRPRCYKVRQTDGPTAEPFEQSTFQKLELVNVYNLRLSQYLRRVYKNRLI
jgi:hypothetical protein